MPYDAPGVPHSVREWYQQHLEAIERIREIFDYTQAKSMAKMRFRRDKSQGRRPATFQVGDLVYHTRVYYNQDSAQRGLSKLLGKWAGPSEIVKILGENTYEVQVKENQTMNFNAQYLCLYKGEDLPIYRSKPEGGLDISVDGDIATVDSKVEADPDPDERSLDSNQEQSGSPGAALTENKGENVSSSEAAPQIPVVVVNHEDFSRKESEVGLKRSHFEMMESKSDDPPIEENLTQSTQERAGKCEFVGQWVLAYEKALHTEGKISLMMAKITQVGEKAATVHVFKPKGVKKRNFFLPLWYKMKGAVDYDTRITDRKISSDWKPWSVVLDENFQVTAVSKSDELGPLPPLILREHYRKVWDREIGETISPYEYGPKAVHSHVPRIEPVRRKSKRRRS